MGGGQLMVVLIVAMAMIGGVLKARYSHGARDGDGKAADAASAAETARLRDEIGALKNRIAVLERVVTDNEGSLRLDREIERLRDPHRA